ncbi:hypothetical protein HUG10_09210 [Halorarum halophilum]|uniref:Uncharacterized protein n=1 Tax=Halorarum halophilum TaxID=2743090 RepID=A0A7D5K7Q4_9EURY|nr:hypothetical protein [Halobaculum halophilum]QLG27719.1 hypothetical protein HUG10_09210 [Halobaculum halophilum]
MISASFVEAAAAAVTAGAALGLYREGRRASRSIRTNARRSADADDRSTGNRRFLRWLAPRALGVEDSRQPAEFDPDTDAARTDGGSNDA